MLRSTNEIIGCRIQASDDKIGVASDFYFDDRTWNIRYLVADTGVWLPGRQVLISPASVGTPDWVSRIVPVRLTTEQIEKSPPIQSDLPVSRQAESKLVEYYGWSFYWGPLSTALGAPSPASQEPAEMGGAEGRQSDSSTLRSVNEVTGYHIEATDTSIGHVEDFVVETSDWSIRFIVIDTRDWLPGKNVLIPRDSIKRIDEDTASVYVDLTGEQIKESPEYDPTELIVE
jgi:uncharacterized protein YrrD